ncbi:ribonuclease HI family protein, partial [Pseudomonas aeruginosa]|uniref:ribonuclease HI family protein n=1 Tax=Pseudomonas aeruginosa TaxID=287 RepID=UPI0027D44766
MILITPEGRRISYALRLAFKATNNEAEYEAMIISLKLVREIGINEISIHSDSQLVVIQITEEFQAKCSYLARYFSKVKEILDDFDNHVCQHVPR